MKHCLTTSELIDLLKQIDPSGSRYVVTEGCDCDGDAASVGIEDSYVMIYRDFAGATSDRLRMQSKHYSEGLREMLEDAQRNIQAQKEGHAARMGITVEELERLLP